MLVQIKNMIDRLSDFFADLERNFERRLRTLQLIPIVLGLPNSKEGCEFRLIHPMVMSDIL